MAYDEYLNERPIVGKGPSFSEGLAEIGKGAVRGFLNTPRDLADLAAWLTPEVRYKDELVFGPQNVETAAASTLPRAGEDYASFLKKSDREDLGLLGSIGEIGAPDPSDILKLGGLAAAKKGASILGNVPKRDFKVGAMSIAEAMAFNPKVDVSDFRSYFGNDPYVPIFINDDFMLMHDPYKLSDEYKFHIADFAKEKPKYAATRRETLKKFLDSDEVSPEEKRLLEKVKERYEEVEKINAERYPSGPFALFSGQVGHSPSVPSWAKDLTQKMKEVYGIPGRVFITTPEDALSMRHELKLYGDYAREIAADFHTKIGGAGGYIRHGRQVDPHVSKSKYIWLNPATQGNSIIVLKDADSANAIDTLIHEVGHKLDKQILDNTSLPDRELLKEAHKRWLADHENDTVKDFITALYTKRGGEDFTFGPNDGSKLMKDSSQKSYFSSFDEWFANQIAKKFTGDEVVPEINDILGKRGDHLEFQRLQSEIALERYKEQMKLGEL